MFCFLLFETMVNSLSPLSLRDAIYSAQVRPRVRGMLSISSTGLSLPRAVRVGCASRLVLSFLVWFCEVWEVGWLVGGWGRFVLECGVVLLASVFTMEAREAI